METPARLMQSISSANAKPGTLRLEDRRLSFRETGADDPTFDVALADVTDVVFPRYNLGTVVRFDAGGERYRLAFLKSKPRTKWSGARFSDVRPARRWGRQWKAALQDRR